MASLSAIPRCVYAMSFLLLLLLCAANGVLVRSRNERERCDLSEKQMHARLQKFDTDTQQTITCRGHITVKYCEGSCRSKTLPSVETSSGVMKMCRCCFETGWNIVDVWLPHCRTEGSHPMNEGRYFQMKEPTGCSCSRCQS